MASLVITNKKRKSVFSSFGQLIKDNNFMLIPLSPRVLDSAKNMLAVFAPVYVVPKSLHHTAWAEYE